MDYDMTLERLPGTIKSKTPLNSNNQFSFWQRINKNPWTRYTIIWSISLFLIVSIVEAVILKVHYDYVRQLSSAAFPVDPITDNVPNIVPNAKALLVYQAIVISGLGFQLILCVDAIMSLSVIQLLSTALFNYAIFVYSIVQYFQAGSILSATDLKTVQLTVPDARPHPTAVLEIIVIVLMAIFCSIGTFLVIKLYKIFGWTLFKELGADVSIKNNLQLYHIYLMLLKLDIFFFFGFDLQFLVLVLINQNQDLTNLILHAAFAIPLSIVVLALAYYSVQHENKLLTYATWAGLIGAMSYLIVKLVDIWTTTDIGKYLSSKNSLTFFESITLIMCAITLVFSFLNYLMYGKGLREKLNHRKSFAG